MCLIDKFVPDCSGFNIRGIKEVGFLPFGVGYKVELVGNKYIITTSTPFTRFWFSRATGFFEENAVFTANDKYLEVSLKLDFTQLDYANREALTPFLDLDVLVYVVDNKDKKWILGVKKGMSVVKYNTSTATRNSGYNGFELNWLGRGLGEVELIELPECDGTFINGVCIADDELIVVANRYGLTGGDGSGGNVDYMIETNPLGFPYTDTTVTKNGIPQTIPFPITSEIVQSEFTYVIFGDKYKVTDYFLGNSNPKYLRVGLLTSSSVDKSTRTVSFDYLLRRFTTPVSPTYKLYITKPDTTEEVFDLYTGSPADNTAGNLVYNYTQLGLYRAKIEVINDGIISALQTFYFILI